MQYITEDKHNAKTIGFRDKKRVVEFKCVLILIIHFESTIAMERKILTTSKFCIAAYNIRACC